MTNQPERHISVRILLTILVSGFLLTLPDLATGGASDQTGYELEDV